MTNFLINLKIAEIEKLNEQFDCLKPSYVEGKLYGCTIFGELPGEDCVIIDYTENWNLLGPLILKLLNKKWFLDTSVNGDYQWCKLDGCNVIGQALIDDEDFSKATCLAYIKEFGDE